MNEQKSGKTPDDSAQNIQILPPIKRYMNAVEFHLHLPLALKARVSSDLATSITARHEAGESYEEIMAQLGSPRQVAARLCAELEGYEVPRRPWWRWLFLAAALAAGLWTGLRLFWLLGGARSIGVIGGADGPTQVYVTGGVMLASSPWAPWLGAAAGAALCAVCAVIFWRSNKQGGHKP